MKILIDIPDHLYKLLKEIPLGNEEESTIENALILAVENGQPIPDDCEMLSKEAYSDLCLRASKGGNI